MADVGCDFSVLALPFFERAVVSRVARIFDTAAALLSSVLTDERAVVTQDGVLKEQVVSLYSRLETSGERDDKDKAGAKKAQESESAAVTRLLAFPPLAHALNVLLEAMVRVFCLCLSVCLFVCLSVCLFVYPSHLYPQRFVYFL